MLAYRPAAAGYARAAGKRNHARYFLTPFGLAGLLLVRTMAGPPGQARGLDTRNDSMSMPRYLQRMLLAALAGALLLPAAVAAELGAIVGLLTNAAGAPVPHATVTAVRADGNAIRATLSGSDGVYSFADLPPGAWSVTAEVEGSPAVTVTALVVRAGKATRHDLVMNVAAHPLARRSRLRPLPRRRRRHACRCARHARADRRAGSRQGRARGAAGASARSRGRHADALRGRRSRLGERHQPCQPRRYSTPGSSRPKSAST